MTQRTALDIQKIVVTNLFVDDRILGWRQGAKFVVLFDPAAGKIDPLSIRSIKVNGPNQYSFEIRPHAKYRAPSFNGYVDDAYLHALWYMAIDRSALLENGLYTIRVTWTDGAVRERSRVLAFNPVLSRSAYANRPRMHFEPTGFVPRNVDLSAARLAWTTLKSLDGPDAYYSSRLSRGLSVYVHTHELAHYDNILELSATDPTAGLNSGQSIASPPLRHLSGYTWFVEALDGNDYETINTAVFFKHQWFATL
jgi:hypothetical protein